MVIRSFVRKKGLLPSNKCLPYSIHEYHAVKMASLALNPIPRNVNAMLDADEFRRCCASLSIRHVFTLTTGAVRFVF